MVKVNEKSAIVGNRKKSEKAPPNREGDACALLDRELDSVSGGLHQDYKRFHIRSPYEAH